MGFTLKKTGDVQINVYETTIYGGSYDEIGKDNSLELFRDKVGGYVINKKELIEQDAGLLTNLNDEQKNIIKRYKGIISSADLGAIRISFVIKNYEDSGYWNDAKNLFRELVTKHKQRGKRIYNLTRSGYIDGLLLSKLGMMEYHSQRSGSYKVKYKKYFNKCMDIFPYAVWANEYTTKKDLYKEILKRLRLRGISLIEVYARDEDNISKITEVISVIVDKEGNALIIQKEEYTIARNPCLRISLRSIIKYTTKRKGKKT